MHARNHVSPLSSPPHNLRRCAGLSGACCILASITMLLSMLLLLCRTPIDSLLASLLGNLPSVRPAPLLTLRELRAGSTTSSTS